MYFVNSYPDFSVEMFHASLGSTVSVLLHKYMSPIFTGNSICLSLNQILDAIAVYFAQACNSAKFQSQLQHFP